MQLQREFDSPKQQERWCVPSSVVGSVVIGPDNTKEVAIPLLAILRGMFAEHSFQCSVKSFHHPVTFGMVGSCVQLLNPHQGTDDFIKCNKFIPRSESKASGTQNKGTTSRTRILAILLDFSSGIGQRGHFDKKNLGTPRCNSSLGRYKEVP